MCIENCVPTNSSPGECHTRIHTVDLGECHTRIHTVDLGECHTRIHTVDFLIWCTPIVGGLSVSIHCRRGFLTPIVLILRYQHSLSYQEHSKTSNANPVNLLILNIFVQTKRNPPYRTIPIVVRAFRVQPL